MASGAVALSLLYLFSMVHLTSGGKKSAKKSDPLSLPTVTTTVKPNFEVDKAEGGDWVMIKRNDKNCFVSDFHGRLSIRSLGKCANAPKTFKRISVDIAGTDIESGRCSSRPDSKTAQINMSKSHDGNDYKLYFLFAIKDTGGMKEKMREGITSQYLWKLDILQVSCQGPSGSARAISNLTEKSPIQAPLKQGFYCRHSVSINLRPLDNDTTVDAKFQFAANTRIKAFDVSDQPNFGNTFLCRRSREIGLMDQLKKQSTTAMGCIFAFSSLGTVAGYALKRNYLQTKAAGYNTME